MRNRPMRAILTSSLDSERPTATVSSVASQRLFSWQTKLTSVMLRPVPTLELELQLLLKPTSAARAGRTAPRSNRAGRL